MTHVTTRRGGSAATGQKTVEALKVFLSAEVLAYSGKYGHRQITVAQAPSRGLFFENRVGQSWKAPKSVVHSAVLR
jgi:hypothetical protein